MHSYSFEITPKIISSVEKYASNLIINNSDKGKNIKNAMLFKYLLSKIYTIIDSITDQIYTNNHLQ